MVEQSRRLLPVGYHLRASTTEIEHVLGHGDKLQVVGSALYTVPSVVFQGLKEDPVRDGKQRGKNPHPQAADVNHPRVPAGVHLGGVDD